MLVAANRILPWSQWKKFHFGMLEEYTCVDSPYAGMKNYDAIIFRLSHLSV
jgi:hypothetical protein